MGGSEGSKKPWDSVALFSRGVRDQWPGGPADGWDQGDPNHDSHLALRTASSRFDDEGQQRNHLGGNRLGGNRLGGNRLGGNRLGGNREQIGARPDE